MPLNETKHMSHLSQGMEAKINITSERYANVLCQSWNAKSGKCEKCVSKSILTEDNKCKVIQPQCKIFSKSNGRCLDCFDGYLLNQGECILKHGQISVYSALKNPLCHVWKEGNCKQCSTHSYLNVQGICTAFPHNCKTFSIQTGLCNQCHNHFELTENRKQCTEVKQQKGFNDPFCEIWNSPLSCAKCEDDCFMEEITNKCIKIQSTCQIFDFKAQKCQTCYIGWHLIRGRCYNISNRFKEQIRGSPFECQHWKNGNCLNCFEGLKLSEGNKTCKCNP